MLKPIECAIEFLFSQLPNASDGFFEVYSLIVFHPSMLPQ